MSTSNSVHTYIYKIHLLQVFFSPWKQVSAATRSLHLVPLVHFGAKPAGILYLA